jgi:hypothetical protein
MKISTNLAPGLVKTFAPRATTEGGGGGGDGGRFEGTKVWLVFLACLIVSALGVLISFVVFGSTITGIQKWAGGAVIAVVMLGISYGAKYANADARKSFTPVDIIQYLSQGFLWPSTWPALADFIGIEKIKPPEQTSYLLDLLEQAARHLSSYV